MVDLNTHHLPLLSHSEKLTVMRPHALFADVHAPALPNKTSSVIFDVPTPLPEEPEFERKLTEEHGITDRLIGLLWANYRDPSGLAPAINRALEHRRDIASPQLKQITDEMLRLLKTGPSSRLTFDQRNFMYGVCFLQHYPSPQHEDIALRMLNSDDMGLRMSAAVTLGQIGTVRSLEALRNFSEPFRNPPKNAWASTQMDRRIVEAYNLVFDRVNKGSQSNNVPHSTSVSDHATALGDTIEQLASQVGTQRKRENAFLELAGVRTPEAIREIARFIDDGRDPEGDLHVPIPEGVHAEPNNFIAAQALALALGDKSPVDGKNPLFGPSQVRQMQQWWHLNGEHILKPEASVPQQPSPPNGPPPPKPAASAVMPMATSEQPQPMPLLMWGMMISAMVGLLWLVLRNRKQR